MSITLLQHLGNTCNKVFFFMNLTVYFMFKVDLAYFMTVYYVLTVKNWHYKNNRLQTFDHASEASLNNFKRDFAEIESPYFTNVWI